MSALQTLLFFLLVYAPHLQAGKNNFSVFMKR
jgi:hypothetical protein